MEYLETEKYNLAIQRGSSVNRQFKLLYADGSPFDFSGWEIASQVRSDYDSPTASAVFAVTASSPPTDGIFIMTLDASGSSALTGSCYYYDIRMTSGSTVLYPLEGKFTVSQRITR